MDGYAIDCGIAFGFEASDEETRKEKEEPLLTRD
jgi:hypothetical protein